jgi:hypothetical protein
VSNLSLSDWATQMDSIDIAKYGLSDFYSAKQDIMNVRYSIIAMFFLQIYELFAVYVFLPFVEARLITWRCLVGCKRR